MTAITPEVSDFSCPAVVGEQATTKKKQQETG
jgi:hypothetical protein